MEEHYEDYKTNLKCEFVLKEEDAKTINNILKSYGIHEAFDMRDVHIRTGLRRVPNKLQPESYNSIPVFTSVANVTFIDYHQWDEVLL